MKQSIIKLIFIFNLYFVAFSILPIFDFKLVDTNFFFGIIQYSDYGTLSLAKDFSGRETHPNPQLREWHFGSYIKYFKSGDYILEISTEANKVKLGSPLIVKKFRSLVDNGEEILLYTKYVIPAACETYTCEYEIVNNGWEGNTKKLLLKFTWDPELINSLFLTNLQNEAKNMNLKNKLDQQNYKKNNFEVEKNKDESLSLSDQEAINIQSAIIASLENNKNTEPSNLKSNNHPTLAKHFSGLENVGNTCYFNALLQTLFMNQEFRNNILSLNLPSIVPQKLANNRVGNSLKMLGHFQKLFGDMEARKAVVDPTDVVNNVYNQDNELMKIGGQEDMLEYFMIFIDHIQAGINYLQSSKSSFYDKLAIEKKGAAATNPVNDKSSNFMDRIFFGKLKWEITKTLAEIESEKLYKTKSELDQEKLIDKNEIMGPLVLDYKMKTVENALKAQFKYVLEEYLPVVN